MIQIYGAGVAGTYLYHLLTKEGYDVSIYDVRNDVDCRCAWAFAYKEAKELYSLIDLNVKDYVLSNPEYIYANGIPLKNKNIVILEKRRLLKDLWVKFEKKDADLYIDATGSERAYLPKIKKDRLLPTIQFVEDHEKDENIYVHVSSKGYSWAFPLGNNRWHIGAGALNEGIAFELIKKLREKYEFDEKNVFCSCRGKVRMLPPSKCKPFVFEKIVGVGEAIGCVSGAGEGNVPSLISAKILFDSLNCLEKYEDKILKELWWIEEEQKFVDAMLEGKKMQMLKILPKVVEFESKRTVEHTISTFLKIIGL
ncbi:MAG: NAD(P)/FAD-dependent oxidoreductase [Archaeoglobaceae archaeon]|nr:NAD(P)/FAD-dependent oxidoreductase [Archaeoglobaceae archaeon]MCX8152461.1 NAD(P)/FAD-dependent oxidoreductase [Archaeoglobaceae archaeon]MDW8013801.1 NAD(P)/FAD-dependent oxidoreductase [Archaeoglobaceae archaeon]